MPRIVAIDYGTKRVGVAVTDELQIIASGLTTVHSSEIIQFLKDYCNKQKVECIVIGEPKSLQNGDTDSTEPIENFVRHMVKIFPAIKIDRIDERFTSVLASRAILASVVKKKKRQDKGLVDEVSATIMLQDYMERKSKGFS